MKQLLCVAVLTLSVGGATLAGSGLVVAPHVDPPGAPRLHTHVLAAYRFPIFLLVLQARLDARQGLVEEAAADVSAVLSLALLAVAWPRLLRPSLTSIAELRAPRIARAQWRVPAMLGPTRASALRIS